MRARQAGKCSATKCIDPNKGLIRIGDEITKGPNGRWMHLRCSRAAEVEVPNCNRCSTPIVNHENRWRGICNGCREELRQVSTWTPALVRQWLMWDNLFLERAITRLFERQTASEQIVEDTRVKNYKGFNAADAKRLSRSAKWIERGNHLDGWFLDVARKKVLKYAKQLCDIIQEVSDARVSDSNTQNSGRVVDGDFHYDDHNNGSRENGRRIKVDFGRPTIENEDDDFYYWDESEWKEWKNKFSRLELEQEQEAYQLKTEEENGRQDCA